MTAPADVTWISEQLEDDHTGFRVGRLGDELWAEFIGIGVLRSDRAALRSQFIPAPGADPVVVEKVRVSLVPALLRHARAEVALHASAVALGGAAISLVGASGAGKSSMAAYLCERHGAELLGDDTTAIDLRDGAAFVAPTEAQHWLVGGSALPQGPSGTKSAVAPRACATQPVRLRAICRLAFDSAASTPVLTHLRGHAALGVLVPALIRFVVDEPEAKRWELDSLLELCARTHIFQLARPPGTDYIEAGAQMLDVIAREVQA